jgi:hypothetical protein
LASPSWDSRQQHGPLGTAAVVEEASVVVASMVAAVSAVAVVSMEEVSVVVSTAVTFVAAVLEAESACAAVESALAERASRVAFQTLPEQDPGSRHLVIHHPGNLSMMDDLIDPFLPTSSAIAARWLQSPVHRKHFRNAD